MESLIEIHCFDKGHFDKLIIINNPGIGICSPEIPKLNADPENWNPYLATNKLNHFSVSCIMIIKTHQL